MRWGASACISAQRNECVSGASGSISGVQRVRQRRIVAHAVGRCRLGASKRRAAGPGIVAYPLGPSCNRPQCKGDGLNCSQRGRCYRSGAARNKGLTGSGTFERTRDGTFDGTFDGMFHEAFDAMFDSTFDGTFSEPFDGPLDGTLDRTFDGTF